MANQSSLSRNIFRYLCLLTALANGLGNIFIVLFYRQLFELLNVPLPKDLHTFIFVAGFSFTMGVLALLIFTNPEKNINLLVIGIIGKGIYSFATFYFYIFQNLHWFYLIFGIWDWFYMIIFFLFLIKLLSPDISKLNEVSVLERSNIKKTKKALMLIFSLTGTGRFGMERIKTGLERKGYSVDIVNIEPEEKIFRFPMTFWDFVQIVIRSILRIPAHIKPLNIPANHEYDLIITETQTWLVGMSAPVEAVFQDPNNYNIFKGRDSAVLVVCRGAWRRSQAMMIRWLQKLGANVVGTIAFSHIGWEPSRILSLWFYLIYKQAGRPRILDGLVQKRYGLSDEALKKLEIFGEKLAQHKNEA